MASISIFNQLIDGPISVVLAILCVFSVVRGIKLKNPAIGVLALVFGDYIATVGLNETLPPELLLIRDFIVIDYPIFIIIFTKLAFYLNRKSWFTAALGADIFLRVVHFYLTTTYRFTIPTYVPIPNDLLGVYYFQALIVSLQLVVAFTFLSFASFQAYHEVNHGSVDPWVRKRYLFIGASNLIFIAASFVSFLFPTDGLSYASPHALVADIVYPPIILSYTVILYLTWVMPSWFKTVLNGREATRPDFRIELPPEVPQELATQAVTMPVAMRGINFLGEKLGPMMSITPAAAKGLLFVAIEHELGLLGIYDFTYEKLTRVVGHSLRQILVDMGIDNADGIVDEISTEILKNQSLFLMMAF